MSGEHTPGPWHLCHHLKSAEKDKSCSCGYRGGIWGSDEGHIVCEIGSYAVPGEEALSPPRYDRPTELANARLIAAAPDLYEAHDAIDGHCAMLLKAIAAGDPAAELRLRVKDIQTLSRAALSKAATP